MLIFGSTRSYWKTAVWTLGPGKDSSGLDGGQDSVSTYEYLICRYDVGSFSRSDSYYEGHSMQSITFPVRVLKLLGVDTIIGTATRK